jgi:hypothetical protein
MGMNDTNRWTDSDLLKRIREFTDSAIKAESTNRTEAVADLKFLAGEQWDEPPSARASSRAAPA